MIKRYLINEIEDIWNQNNKISTWKKVESSVTKQLEDAGIVPKGLSAEILKVNISLEEFEKILAIKGYKKSLISKYAEMFEY